jgi:hypothetical protein
MNAEQKAEAAYIIRRIAEENQKLALMRAEAFNAIKGGQFASVAALLRDAEGTQEMLDALHLDLFLETGVNVSEHSDETLNDWASDFTV